LLYERRTYAHVRILQALGYTVTLTAVSLTNSTNPDP